jgi:tRNA A37 threonylcarbamoyladenosine synthetase subunit TsaC/SUA5/YrdC
LIDGGIIPSQGESTIVEIVEDDIKILRAGHVSEKEIRELN